MHRVARGTSFAIAITGFLMSAQFAFADTPIVVSFAANPTSFNNDYSTALKWAISSGTGSDIYFNCPVGVTLKKDGSSFPCSIRTSMGSATSDSAGFAVTNVSGTTKNIQVTLYPKDSNGADYDAGVASLTLTVGTSPQPITNFTVSTSTISGGQITLTWTGVDIANSNIQFECADQIRIYSDSATILTLPCSVPAFSTDQAQSGSLTVYPVSTSNSSITITARVIPAIAAGSYDLTHALSATFVVLPKPVLIGPSVASFSSSATNVYSGTPLALSWSTFNSAGVNLQFYCSDGLTISALIGTTTSPLPCNAPAFYPALGAQGTTTLIAINKNSYGSSLMMMIMPQGFDGTYYQASGRSLNFIVYPGSAPAATNAPAQTPTASSQVTSTPGQQSAKHYTFTISLKRGSKSADVTALQKFLALNPSIYPEGLVTGLFGPATERAIGRLQVKYKIANVGDVGYLTVGPRTRALLNSITTP